MINIVDLVIAALGLIFLLKNAGGIGRTVKNLIVLLVLLVIFGLLSSLFIEMPLPSPLHKTLEDSYFVRLSHLIIRWVYPAVEKSAPQIDSFVKDKIISAPTPEVSSPEKLIPRLNIPASGK